MRNSSPETLKVQLGRLKGVRRRHKEGERRGLTVEQRLGGGGGGGGLGGQGKTIPYGY